MSPTLFRRAQCVPYHKFRVRGGAMLGLIVGIIVGLAVALGVALYVAKVPIPFVNNAPVPNNEQNNAENQKNSNWNPNATLQTHGPVLPASSVSSAAAGTQPASAPPQQPVAVPPPVEVERPAPASVTPAAQAGNAEAPSGDILGDFAAARVRAAERASSNASPAAVEPAFIYYIQTGAYRHQQDADAERARLSLLGMDAATTESDQAGYIVYRVRVGPFQNKAAADQISGRLTDNGFEAALVRVLR